MSLVFKSLVIVTSISKGILELAKFPRNIDAATMPCLALHQQVNMVTCVIVLKKIFIVNAIGDEIDTKRLKGRLLILSKFSQYTK